MTIKIEAVCVAILMLAGLPAGASGDSEPCPRTAGQRTPDNNNDFANATNIISGVPDDESVDIADDVVDYYRIVDEKGILLYVEVGQVVEMVVNFTNSSASLNLSLYNNTGNLLVKVSSGGQSRGTTFLVTVRRYMYLEVRADNCTSDYTITVWVGYPQNITSGCAVRGHLNIGGADRVDYYQINGTVGQTVKMALDFTDLSANLSLRMLSPSGSIYTTVTSGGQSRGTTYFVTSSNKTFYFEVKVNNNTSDYTFTVTLAYPPTLSSGVAVNGALSINGTERLDYYKVTVQAEQTLDMVLTATNLSANLGLRLLDVNNSNFLSITTGGTTRGSTYLVAWNWTYYIEVKVNKDESDYTLTVTLAYPQTLSPGARVSGSLSVDGADRVDYYRFWLAGNVSGSAESALLDLTQSGQYFSMQAAIFDNMPGYGWQMYNESYNLSKRASLGASAAHTGWYFCSVSVISGTSGYTLNYTRSTAPSDGNNDYANATPIPRNGAMYGNVSKARDHYDWYACSAAKDDVVRIQVERANSTDLFSLIVYNSSRSLLYGRMTQNRTDQRLNCSLTTPKLQNETFYIGVSARTAFRANPSWALTDDESYMNYSLTVIANNKPPEPVVSIDPIVINEDEKLRLNMSSHFYDIDGDLLNYTIIGTKQIKGTYDNISGELELCPSANWFGKVDFQIEAVDGRGGGARLPVSVTVIAVEDPPVAKALPNITMSQNGTDRSLDLGKYMYDNDTPYGDCLTFRVSGNGTIRVSMTPEGNVTLTAPINFWGVQNMTFTATDNASMSASSECLVTVGHVNQAPQVKAAPPEVTMNEDEDLTLDLAPVFWDPDGDPMTVAASGSDQVNLTQKAGTLYVNFRAAPDASGFTENIRVTARDDKGAGGNFVTVRVTVVPVNDPPRITSFSPACDVVMRENQTQDFSISAFDIENGAVVGYTWYLDDQPVMMGLTAYSYRANFSSAGCHTMEVSVDDGELSTVKAWNLTVLNVNHEPGNVAMISPKPGAVVREGVMVLFEGSAQDPDGDVLVFTWLDESRTLGTGRTLSMVLPVGSHSITMEVSDGEAVVTSKVAKIVIKANSAPKMEALSPTSGQKFTKGDRIHFAAVFSDPENDVLSYCWTEGGNVLSTSPTFDRSDLPVGKHTIALTVSDGILTTDTTLTVEVVEKSKGGFIPGMGACALGVAALVALVAARGRRRPAAG